MLFWLSVLIGSILLIIILYIVAGIVRLKWKGEEVMKDRKFKRELKDLGMNDEDIDITMEDLKQVRKESEEDLRKRQ